MPYRGRSLLGSEIPLGVLTVDGSDLPSAPAAAPTMDIYTSAGAKIISAKAIPAMDRYGVTGLFQYKQLLDARFATGMYTVAYHYTISSYIGLIIDTFEVVAGGNSNGTPIAAAWYNQPQADFLVWQTDAGKIQKGRNPAV